MNSLIPTMKDIRQTLAVVVATFLIALPSAGQVPDQLKNSITTPVPGNFFGSSSRGVSISGTLLAVGAPGDDTGATDAGSAYVYDLSSTTPTVPAATLNNPSPAVNDQFGARVAIDGTRVVVTAQGDDTGASNAGSVYLYDLSSIAPTVPVTTLNNPRPAVDRAFGGAVAISGSWVVVGVPGDTPNISEPGAGIAYVYDLGSATPRVPVFTLGNPHPVLNDSFGGSVAISGTRVVVGTPGDNREGGRAYVYDLGSVTPTVPEATLNNPSPGPRVVDVRFGGSVAIDGTRVVVGAYRDNTGADLSGSAYVYDLSSVTPTTPVATLNNPSPATEDGFGVSVAISSTRVVVGVGLDDMIATNAGSAYVYELNSATPTTPVAMLNNPTPATDDRFGLSVAIDGSTVAIGTPGGFPAPTYEGSVYIFGPASPPVDGDNDGLLDAWELTYWPTTAGHGPLDDFDHDGIPELLELAFGLNPTISDPAGLPTPTNEGGYLTMTITKHAGVTCEVHSAGTLLPALPDSFNPATTTVLLENATTLKVRDNVLTGSQPARFLRVQVTAAP